MKSLPDPMGSGLQLDRLGTLADELGSPLPALQFLAKYLMMLPARVEKIAQSLQREDHEATIVAVLSLKISSAMVGAVELEAISAKVESLPRASFFYSAEEHLASLQQTAGRLYQQEESLLRTADEALRQAA